MELSPELKPYVDMAKKSPLQAVLSARLGRSLKTEGEVRPTDIAPVIAPDRSRKATVFPMVWGFTNPRSGGPVLNARVETAPDKSFWREAWAKHRCVIPASGYFEWEHFIGPDGKKKTGRKYRIRPQNSPVTFLAGLYQIEEQRGIRVPVFTVLTREPAESIRFIHDRMPLILPQESIRSWISPEAGPDQIAQALQTAVTEMCFEKML